VLPDHTAPAMPISLLYPHRRHVPPRVQAMLQWMEQLVRAELDAPLQAAAPPRGGKARR